MAYIVQSPILLLNFNRPDLTTKVFEKIRSAQPSRFYIAIDGPRKNNHADAQKCKDVKLVFKNIDWDCTVKTLFRDENLGCKKGVSTAIDWFFENENEGIVLEDDCLPTESFFYFCDEILDRYRHDTRISLITGTNLQNGIIRGEGSYYFSQYSNIWGCASWKRTWANYDSTLMECMLLFANTDSKIGLNNYTKTTMNDEPNRRDKVVTCFQAAFHRIGTELLL